MPGKIRTPLMAPLLKQYFKVFLITGIPFALLMSVLDLINNNAFSIWKFLFMTCFFGIAMSITLVSLHRYRLGKIGVREITPENLKVSQTKSVRSKLNLEELTEKLKADPHFGKMKMINLENGILLKSGTTWKSWGEEIRIILQSGKNEEYDYEVSSSPSLKTTFLDYGKNLENVNYIERLIF